MLSKLERKITEKSALSNRMGSNFQQLFKIQMMKK
jgi:hypothetical protein